MRILKIHLYRICIPFKKTFRHAIRKRSFTDNIVVETSLEDGTVGYGEGLPREYVTGETPEGVIDALKRLPSSIFQVDFRKLENSVGFLESEILSRKHLKQDRSNNTARCALELSLLDAYCQTFKATFLDVVKTLSFLNADSLKKVDRVYYDGILSLDSLLQNLWDALKMKLFGFRRLKLKVGPDVDATLRTINSMRKIVGNRVDLRVDANESWNLETAVHMARELRSYSVSAIEQPLPHAELMKMQELKKASPIPLMLDESLCSLEDAQKAIQYNLSHLFNIRLSKCGGFLNSLKIAALARQNALGYQLGCMVGETGILSAAGRQFAMLDPSLKYLEGSFDRYLLKDNIIREEISFGRRGKALPLEGYGLGIHIDSDKLRKYATFQTRIFG